MSDEVLERDGLGQAKLIRKGEISAPELMEATIRRIERINPEVNALASYDFDLALERSRKGAGEGPFAGVPFLMKDLISYPGLPLSMGSRLFAGNMGQESSPYVERIDSSGLIVLGKSATSEFGLLGSTETALLGITRHPLLPGYSASGSSGGAAAAVSSGMVPLAHGDDAGGSLRIPASVHGLFALKPGAGRIVPALSAENEFVNLVTEHCITRSVRDSAALLAWTERRNEEGSLPPVGFVEEPIRRNLRIGVYRTTLMGELPEPELLEALNRTVRLCESLGHRVEEVPPPPVDGEALSRSFFTVAGSAMSQLSLFMEGILGKEPD
jgi:amidase